MSPRLFFCVLASLAQLAQAASATEWFVDQKGNDSWSGRQFAVPSSGNEGPFATLERARSAVREARAAGDTSQQTVSVRAGTYRVREAFTLGKADSGENGSPVIWRAFPGEEPVFNGTVVLEGWAPWKNGIFKAALPKASKGVRQLLLKGERQTLARYPNATPEDPVAGGWAFADGPQWPMYADIPGEDKRTLQVRPPDWRPWAKPSQVELCIFPRYNWWNNRVRVQAVDPVSYKVTLAGDCSYAIRNGDRFFLQNALEELDTPGEWYADAEEGALYFWPPTGSKPEEATPVMAQSLVKFEPGAHDIVWQGFIMEGCDASAIVLTETRRCVVENNLIRAVGDWNGHGVSVSKGVENRVRYNKLEQIGNTAITLNGGDIPSLTEANNVAEHNEIHHFGVYYKQGVGVSLSGVGNRALHNHIHHGPRFGINHSGNRNEIAFNHIHDVCLETEDTGAIYSNGRDWITPRGTNINYNFIHDVPGFSMHNGKAVTPNFAWGIYLDDNSSGVNVFGNIVTKCGRGGMHAHGARDCFVENNIFLDNRDWQIDFHGWTTQQKFWERHLPEMVKGYESMAGSEAWKSVRGMDLHPNDAPLPDGLTMRGNRFEKNIVVSPKQEVPVVSILRVPFTHNTFDSNLYWTPGGSVIMGFQSAGPNEGDNLLTPFSGEPGEMPKGWRWSTKPAGNPLATMARDVNGVNSLQISADDADSKKVQPLVFGNDIDLEPGATYRLSAKVRATVPEKAALGMQSFVSKVYFWMSPKSEVEVSNEWKNLEWVFEVPAPGKPNWVEQMKWFSPRIGWRCNNGQLEVADLQLHRASPKTEWDSWRTNGVDAHSVVADPLWDDAAIFSLQKNSPAWLLGFQPIPFEQIGPQNKKP